MCRRASLLSPRMRSRTRPPSRRTTYGGRQTWKEDFYAAGGWDRFGAAIEGTVLDTNGFYIVPLTEGGSALRGPVDTKAQVNNENFNIKLEFNPTDRITAFARTG